MAKTGPQTTMLRNIVKMGVGIAVGMMLSIVPVFIFALCSVALAVIVFIRTQVIGWRCDAVASLTTCTVLAICLFLPTKQLDAKVGPFAYDDLSLADLCERLNRDHGVICHVPDKSAQVFRLSFSTKVPLSRRQVLEKLSRETGRHLYILYCGTNASILFGADPSFTYLGEEMRRIRGHDSRY